jgi:primosomal protein N' (replication factor Y) (superfamily II helicase)
VVRVPLHGRRVRGWVLDADSTPPSGVELSEITHLTGAGPDSGTIDLCRWVARRWVGRLPSVLRLATPDRVVAGLPTLRVRPADPAGADPAAGEALDDGPGVHVLRVPPTRRLLGVAIAAAARGQALVVTPSAAAADFVADRLRRAGAPVARWPGDFAAASGGATVVGGRGAVFAPLPGLAAVVVWDEHDEGLQHESSPTWHAREVAVERARRAGVPCLLVSPCPSLEARALSEPVRGDRGAERAGWAQIDVVDRRGEDLGRSRLASSSFVRAARAELDSGGRVVCVLNRTGRARLLACRSCGVVTGCASCGSAVRLDDDHHLSCGRCGATRPPVCLDCGSSALGLLRLGVTRAREELEALLRVPVVGVTAAGTIEADRTSGGVDAGKDPLQSAPVVVGTEAALHRVRGVGLVAFLDMDQELLAPRYRAAEEALALLVLASRVVGGRDGGRVLVQTRLPDHEVLRAAVRADPDVVADAERGRRDLLGLPPAAAVALVGGEAAGAFVERLGRPLGVEVLGPDDGNWLVRADDHETLAAALGRVERPPGRLRLRVDPVRLR